MPAFLRDPIVLYYIFAVIIAFPVVRILARAGLEKYWAALLAVPMVGLGCVMGVLTFRRWPVLFGGGKAE